MYAFVRERVKTVNKHTKRYLEKICGDVYYVECPSYNGYCYYIVLIDDFTSFSFIILLKERGEFRFRLDNWYKEVTEGGKYRIEIIQLDRAGEFIDQDVKDFCIKYGVKLQYTLARQHQQNGLAERRIRTLNDKQRTMLHAGKFPLSLWAEAVMTANDILNLSPAKRNHDRKSPYHMRYGHSPPILHLRTFGCVAWAYVDIERRTKLSPRAIKCIFVGYLKDRKGYRLLEIKTMKPILTRNVIFFEKKYATIPNKIPHAIDASYRDVPAFTNESHIDTLFRHVEQAQDEEEIASVTSSNKERTRTDHPDSSQERPEESSRGGTIDQIEDRSIEDNLIRDERVPVNYTDEEDEKSNDFEERFDEQDKNENILIKKIKQQTNALAKARKELTLKKLQEWSARENETNIKDFTKDHAILTLPAPYPIKTSIRLNLKILNMI
jgi:transposase InsO family protein